MDAESLQKIEDLVKQLYTPGNAQAIKQLESQLRELQKSSFGWEIADHLLASGDLNIRFFGALTFQIKINTGSDELDDAALWKVGQRLIHWLLASLGRGDAPLILRKLCSTITDYFLLQREIPTQDFVRRVTLSVAHNESIDFATADLPQADSVIESLTDKQMTAILWLLVSMAEEAIKASHSPIAGLASLAIARMESNLEEVELVYGRCLSIPKQLEGNNNGHELQMEALQTLKIWIKFAQKASWEGKEAMSMLRNLMDTTLEWFEHTELDETAEVLGEILYDNSNFFTTAQKDRIAQFCLSPTVQGSVDAVGGEAFEEVPRMVWLLIVFSEQILPRLVESHEDEFARRMLESMRKLLEGPGFPAAEDVVALEALEFWTAYVEFIADAEFDDPDEDKPWMPTALTHLVLTIKALWKKVKLPTRVQFKELDTDKQKEFRQFRVDVKELLLAAYPSLRTQLTSMIAQLCLEALAKKDWLEVEASLFCLHAISVAEQESEDQLLGQIFGSELFVHLKNEPNIPPRVQAMGVEVLGQYAEFFERHTDYLPSVLDFLFVSLRSAAFATKSARAINRLCSSCRGSLGQQLPTFIQAYQDFLSWPTAEASTKEKVIGGIAAIAQGLPSLDEHATVLFTLMGFIRQDLEQAQYHFTQQKIEEAQVAALNALRCLASVGKSFQSPDDDPLDDSQEISSRAFWQTGNGSFIPEQIFAVITSILDMFTQAQHAHIPVELHGEVIEAVCSIFKSGFTETKPGPFVFSASTYVDFFSTMQLTTPRLEIALNTSCSFLRSHSHTSSPDVVHEASRLLSEVFRLITSISNLREEDNTTGLLEVMDRFMPRYTGVFFLLRQEDVEALFAFPLECLTVPEPLPKRAAAEFWTTFLNVTPSRSKVSQNHLDEVIQHFGPRLSTAILRNVTGEGTRSDLDWFVDPLRKLMTRSLPARKTLEQALAAIGAQRNIAPDAQARFLKQLSIATSSSTAKKVVSAFWSQCRGIDGSYAP